MISFCSIESRGFHQALEGGYFVLLVGGLRALSADKAEGFCSCYLSFPVVWEITAVLVAGVLVCVSHASEDYKHETYF